ncbi:MAG: DUF2764 family protein [Verrucomicrobiota bacterium]
MFRTRHQYYGLVASLPALPRIGQTERLPINEPRLDERLRMLQPADASIVANLRHFIQWQNRNPNQTDAEIAAQYRELLEKNKHPAVRSAIEFRINLRTILAALRRRLRGENSGPSDPDWGLGPWVSHIERNWGHPDFRLGKVFPWITEARQFLENGEAFKLEELAMNLVWDALDRSSVGKYFELENVIAFVFKWDVLNRWLSYREDNARAHFDDLAATLFPDPILPSPANDS